MQHVTIERAVCDLASLDLMAIVRNRQATDVLDPLREALFT